MVVTFVSNYINHHQLPFCNAMAAMEDMDFYFIQTSPMEEKRVAMGWGTDDRSLPFVKRYYEQEEECKHLILDSDVTILGWSDGIVADIEKERLSSGKLTFRVSERIYREGQWKFISPRGLKAKYNEHCKYRSKPVFLLCAGAYVASDFSLIRSYPGKKLKWGYYPQVPGEACERQPIGDTDEIKICWAGRLIDLKHPESAVEVARMLKEKGYKFSLDIIGDGYLKESLQEKIDKYGVGSNVRLQGSKKPSEVYEYMKSADVFLFTSNYLEGWGAVVNEAMNCGCAVVASYEAGAVPFLIQDNINGLYYKKGSCKELEKKVLYLFENRDRIREIGYNANATIEKSWNAKSAAAELVRFCKEYMSGQSPKPAADGPMSTAENIKPAGLLRSLFEKNRLE